MTPSRHVRAGTIPFVRVIAGEHRGRPLVAPPGIGTRPTSDRVREAVFDVLQSIIDVSDTRVLDLFAGSGALGIEALSRGALWAEFVDDSADAIRSVRTNLDTLALSGRARVVKDGVDRYLRGAPEADLAFCDPPYAFQGWPELLAKLRTPWVVIESSRPVRLPPPWESRRNKRYGGTLVTVAWRRPQPHTEEKGTP
ncbi:MAG: RsmD family RNA methyltransferase [Acidimicrobiales bacterium]